MTEINGLLISSPDEDGELSIATISPQSLWMNAEQVQLIINDLQTKLKEMKSNETNEN